MKHMHKFASVLLALVMALSLMVPAFAAEGETVEPTNPEVTEPAAPEATDPATSLGTPVKGPQTITIEGATKDHTYDAYQIFKGNLSASSTDNGDLTTPVLSNIEWGAGVDAAKAIEAAKNVLKDDTLTTAAEVAAKLNEKNAKAFAQAIKDALAENPTASGTATSETLQIQVQEVGYYLIKDHKDDVEDKDDSITLFMLQVVGPTKVTAKAGVPTPDKKIVEGDKLVNTGNYNIGDTVTFQLTATLPNNYENYKTYKLIFHDKMSAGLTMGEVQSITLTRDDVQLTSLKNFENYVKTSGTADKCTLEVAFDNLKEVFSGAENGDTITVTYTATLNKDAEVGNPGNPNTMHLEFSNNPNDEGDGETGKTPDKEVLVFTYELDTTKVDGQNPDTKLEGAEFRLFKGKAGQDGKVAEANRQYVKITDGKVSGWTEAGVTEGAATLTSDKEGLFVISGLDAGTYYLEETKAPTGYNLLADPIKVVITATIKDNDGVPGVENALEKLEITVGEKTEAGNASTGIVNTTVQNNKGATLPETGGIGTTIFYVVGGLLTVGAVVLLVTKKRMSADSDK